MKRFVLFLLFFSFSHSLIFTAAAQRPSQAYWDYIQRYSGMAQDQMRKHGIPASITLAQGLLESGAGRSDLAQRANNHFGIKVGVGWNGPYVVKSDDRPDDRFRKYGSVAESYEDHSQFLLKPRYASLFQLSPTDYKAWARGLKRCGYATSPTYAEQLITIIENYNLHQYDTGSIVRRGDHRGAYNYLPNTPGVRQPNVLSSREQAEQLFYQSHQLGQCNGIYYIVVQQGDNLPTISMMTGLRKRRLRRYNELPKDYVPKAGDILFLGKKKSKADKAMKGIPHLVQVGESMYSISQRYGIRLKSLYKLNSLPEDYMPQPGHMLRVR